MNIDMNQVTDIISRALDRAGLARTARQGGAIRGTIDRALAAAGLTGSAAATASMPSRGTPGSPAAMPPGVATAGDFLSTTHTSAHGRLDYKLYVPTSYVQQPMPLLVMLHGCKQSPDDFAAGTRMNEHAERHGFLVAYPAQTARANGGNCWNWFEPAHQTRDGAEPALIAGMVRHIGQDYGVLPGKVFAGGLSAGAAMAVVLGQTYPEVFAAVAAHSGLPVGAAHDVASAFAAMRAPLMPVARHPNAAPVRTIVFHGDADSVVSVHNGAAIVGQAVAAFEQGGERLQRLVRLDAQSQGRTYTMTEFTNAAGSPMVEEWVVHGAGHAWSGGSITGSFADARGPDASDEMVRFFLKP